MRFVRSSLIFTMLAASASAQFLPDIRVSPVRVATGSGDTTFTISGINLKPSFQIRWDGQPRPTTFVSQWTMKVLIPSSDLARPGLSRISLWDSDQGSRASNDTAVLVYLPLRSWDMVYDATRARIYASLSQVDANGPSVAVIDPAKGIVERYVPLPAEGGLVALSSGARYLYVAMKDRIRRMDLSDAGTDLDIPFLERVNSILPLPGDGTSFVVVFGGSSYRAVVFDGAVERLYLSTGAPRCLVGSNGTALYGGPGFRLVRLDATGLPFDAEITLNTLLGGFACPVFAGGLLYGSNGDIVDPSGPTRQGRFGAWGVVDVAPERNQAYFLGFKSNPGIVNTGSVSLMVFDSASHALLSSTYLPVGFSTYTGRLVHWGADGLAFAEYGDANSFVTNGIYLLRTES